MHVTFLERGFAWLCVSALVEVNILDCDLLPPFREPLLYSLEEVLNHASQSEMFGEGISYALIKVAKLGHVPSAQMLLDYGAFVHFEGDVKKLEC